MSTTAQKPTIGRIVHYHPQVATPVDHASAICTPEPRAALVVRINPDGSPVLRVFVPEGNGGNDFTVDCRPGGYEREGVEYSDAPKFGCWSWPPRI